PEPRSTHQVPDGAAALVDLGAFDLHTGSVLRRHRVDLHSPLTLRPQGAGHARLAGVEVSRLSLRAGQPDRLRYVIVHDPAVLDDIRARIRLPVVYVRPTHGHGGGTVGEEKVSDQLSVGG